jgi:hypothetical protein
MYIRILATRCLIARVNVGIQTTVYIFQSALFHWCDVVRLSCFQSLTPQLKYSYKDPTYGPKYGATTLSITIFTITTFSITTFSITTFSMMTFSMTTFSIMTFSIMTFSKTIFIIMTLSTTIKSRDNQHNDTQHNGMKYCYAECLG